MIIEEDIKAFYRSPEWRAARFAFLSKVDRKCQCCGATPDQPGVRIVVDHILSVRRHWEARLHPGNFQILCDDCNLGKGSKNETNFHPTRNRRASHPLNRTGTKEDGNQRKDIHRNM